MISAKRAKRFLNRRDTLSNRRCSLFNVTPPTGVNRCPLSPHVRDTCQSWVVNFVLILTSFGVLLQLNSDGVAWNGRNGLILGYTLDFAWQNVWRCSKHIYHNLLSLDRYVHDWSLIFTNVQDCSVVQSEIRMFTVQFCSLCSWLVPIQNQYFNNHWV